ncbi:hypothetical protein ANCCAN_26049 [Ancylostoma caninum]|uniref:Uncharacterized protein n=1 Tax=Ancylostoma caninum TaxID=29170 RepID=A0A368FBC1_ANCCA|nr:hypothetical protein ANCCAN_26049 [Ancylostoma caninum]
MPRSGNSKDKDKEKFTKEISHGKEKQKEKILRKSDRVDISRAGPSSGRRASDVDKPERKHSARPADELKLLQDSLSQFFTPSTGRRCRQPPRKFDESGVNSDDSVHHHSDVGCEKPGAPAEKISRRKKSSTDCSIMKPLTVDVDSRTECTGSCSSTRCKFISLVRSLEPLFMFSPIAAAIELSHL